MKKQPPRHFGRRLIRLPLFVIGALYFVIEELLWTNLLRLFARLSRLALVAAIEESVRRMPAYGAVALVVGLLALILPAEGVGLYLMASGHAVSGLSIILGVKIVNTALAARCFHLTQGRLMQIGWFRRLSTGVLAIKAQLYAAITQQPWWRALTMIIANLKASLRRALYHKG